MRHTFAVPAVLLGVLVACAPGPRPRITDLAAAAREGDAAAISALAAAGQDVNGIDPGGNHWTPLLHAIHKRQPAALDALIAAGADVNRASAGGTTPLLMAVGNGQREIVRRLLAAGANPKTDGTELLATAVSGGALTDIENPLLGRCNTDVVRLLLARAPDLRLPPGFRGRLALLFARMNNCEEVIRLTQSRS